ncbi:putative alpha-1,2-galactosyltransferase [Penicillium rolfsii]|nr:putative alpha-1,2-galactosyltransferase [Penicillium rolfsii]
MQFALPPRRSPHTLPGAHSSRLPLHRRKQLKTIAIFAFAILALLYLLSHLFASSSTSLSAPAGTAGVVIVTLLDHQRFSESYINKIITNREDYAKRHGYTNFFASVSDYEEAIGDAPRSWALVPAMRHAMATHPKSKYFFHLSPHALIMNPTTSLKSHLLDPSRLESLMLKNVPIVPPDSIIKTFALKQKDVDLIITQDSEDLSPSSFILRNGDYARFFLDLWFDPLFRSYNFAKAETHGLDHIMQWHPTVLARTALVPQRILNAYSKDSSGASPDGSYKDGDFVIRFPSCDEGKSRDCDELDPYYSMWLKKAKST